MPNQTVTATTTESERILDASFMGSGSAAKGRSDTGLPAEAITYRRHPALNRKGSMNKTVKLGDGPEINRLAYGTMQLPGEGVWGPSKDPEGAKEVLRRAVDLGVDFFDTANSYGPYVAEELLREAYPMTGSRSVPRPDCSGPAPVSGISSVAPNTSARNSR